MDLFHVKQNKWIIYCVFGGGMQKVAQLPCCVVVQRKWWCRWPFLFIILHYIAFMSWSRLAKATSVLFSIAIRLHLPVLLDFYPNDKRIINSCCGKKAITHVACAKRNFWWTLISLTECAKVIKTYSGVIKFGLNVQNKKSCVTLFSVYYIW